MTKTLHAIFDGKALKPEGSVDLEMSKRYVLTIESKQKGDVKDTLADTSRVKELLGWSLKIGITEELEKYTKWQREICI